MLWHHFQLSIKTFEIQILHSLTIIQLTSLKAKFSWCCEGKTTWVSEFTSTQVRRHFNGKFWGCCWIQAVSTAVELLCYASCWSQKFNIGAFSLYEWEVSIQASSTWVSSRCVDNICQREWNTSLKVGCLGESFCANDEWLNVEEGKFWLLLQWKSELADFCCWQEIDS